MAKFTTSGICLNTAAELEEWRLILAQFGKKMPKSRYKIINGYVYYHGTIDDLTLCWNGDLLVARKKSSLDGKRFKKEKCFEGSRRSAERFAEGNQLASSIYAMVFHYRRTYPLFCFLKKRAILLIKEGKTGEEAGSILRDYLESFGLIRKERRAKSEERGNQDRCVEGEGRDTHSNSIFQPIMKQVLNIPSRRVASEVIQDDS